MSKAEEANPPPPAYVAVPTNPGQPGASYPTQPYQQPPPYQADGKMGYNGPEAYQTQYPQQPGYGAPGQTVYGQPVQPGQAVLVQPQAIHMVPMMVNPPETHMLFSVLATLCCCWPIGIFAIMKSMEVNNAISRGDRQQAEISSARAYKLAKYAVIAGAVFTVLMVILLVIFYSVIFSMNDFD